MERVLKKDGIAVIATEYIINDKDHPEFFNRKTIYSDLIDKLDSLKLVEPLDLRITTKTLDTVMDYPKTAVYWDNIKTIVSKKLIHIFYYELEIFYLPQSCLSFKRNNLKNN